jgi:gas vesicle protein GvpL/GvpF
VGDREPATATDALAAEMAPALVAEARAQATANVRAVLVRRLSARLLQQCEEVQEQSVTETRGPDAEVRDEEPTPGFPPEEVSHPLVERERAAARGIYVYGVVADGSRVPPDLAGVDSEMPVSLVEGAGLAAIVSEVPLAEFGEETIREHLNDVAWLEEKARAHEAVLEAALGSTDALVPMRLCTIFAAEDQVREMLADERAVLLDALERLSGKAEWGVKAFADPQALDREVAARAGAEDDEQVPAGIAYMNRKRREARAREEAEEVADGWARLMHDRLQGAAAEALLNPLQRPELSGNENEMLLNGVYLVVAGEGTDRFRDLVTVLQDDFDRKGVEIVLTGPWPAYNFVKSSIEAAR